MSSEAHVAQLQDLLERVQRNRLSLAEARSRPAEIAPPAVEDTTEDLTPIELVSPIEVVTPVEAAPPIEAVPIPPAKVEPEAPVFELQPVEPEPELEPLPDEPVMTASEPFEEVAASHPIPLVAPGQAELDLAPQPFPGTVAASGPVAGVSGTRELQRSFALEAVLFRAWRLGRDGGSR